MGRLPLLTIVFLCVAALALVMATRALNRGQIVFFVVLLTAAVLLWRRSGQGR